MRLIPFLPYFLIPCLIFLFFGCRSEYRPQQLVGTWKVDSVYSFYNGFDYWQYKDGADWATYIYHSDGRMDEVRFEAPRRFRYQLSGDTLYWESLEEPGGGFFQVLSLKKDRMVLRKDKAPMFGDQTEERYEIRFFSRAKD